MARRPSPPERDLLSYWPHVGLAAGLCLNLVGLATATPDLIATGSNVLTVCGLFLFQRHRNEKR
jgi:hypothetical protein